MSTSISQSVIKLLDESENVTDRRQIGKIIGEVKRFLEKTKVYIETNHIKFQSSTFIRETYLPEGEYLINETESILQNADGIQNTTSETNEDLQHYVDELKNEFLMLKVYCKILRIDDLFQSLEEAKNNADEVIVTDIIVKLKDLIDDPTDMQFRRLECYHIIKLKYRMESDALLQSIKQTFDKLVQLTEKTFQNNKLVTLKISKEDNQLHETILSLFNARFNPRKMCEFLMTNCIEPIVERTVSMEFRDDLDPEFLQLTLSYSLKNQDDTTRPNYKIVFKNLEMFLLCLGHLNVQLADNLNVFNIFGDHMKERMLSLIVNECLMNSLPATVEESDESSLASDVMKFQKFLVDSQLINEKTDTDLTVFTEKLDVLCRNRFYSGILGNAVDIMQKDLLESTLLAERNTPHAVADNPFIFPCCMVSKTILELIHLLDRIIRQVDSVGDSREKQLIAVIPSVIHRYIIEVPMEHKKILLNIPQATALFYNNTMFLAHWVTKNFDKGIPTFASLVKNLQFVATEHFNFQIRNQRQMFLKIIQKFDLPNNPEALGITPQKQIRDCLSQLEQLRNNWQCILPELLYNKTTCDLLNDLSTEVLRKIMMMENIAPKLTGQLAQLLGVVTEKAPKLFKDPTQITNAKVFMKLSQLKMILGASLSQITEQWGHGKGPLTASYKNEEIKHLIRAIFENTDRRANALALIV